MDGVADLYDEELRDEIQLLGSLLAAAATSRQAPLTVPQIDAALGVRPVR